MAGALPITAYEDPEEADRALERARGPSLEIPRGAFAIEGPKDVYFDLYDRMLRRGALHIREVEYVEKK